MAERLASPAGLPGDANYRPPVGLGPTHSLGSTHRVGPMTSVDTELVLVALAAMLSPVTLFLSVLALVVGERPMRTGLWFFLGAFGVTLVVGVIAAFALGNAVASPRPSTPKTWVAIVDVVSSVIVLFFVVRFLRRPRDPKKVASMIDQMSTSQKPTRAPVSTSPSGPDLRSCRWRHC